MTDWEGAHIGRSWSGTPIEDECPCPKADCGLVVWGQTDPECEQHQPTKTIRQGHDAEDCPCRVQ